MVLYVWKDQVMKDKNLKIEVYPLMLQNISIKSRFVIWYEALTYERYMELFLL
jgi:hypothetical protein